ncbi:hypothetical protein [Sorangium sp. So ce131]|uniref:hypothetical protein n=1 Tax=Sorangium sp. So ce131 TaxID=3133282 RepID=UPI003F63D6FF
MLRLDDLLDICERLELNAESQWNEFPSERNLRRCLDEAEERAGFSPSPTEEAAALFFSLSFNENLLGDAAPQLAVRALYVQFVASGLRMHPETRRTLPDMKDRIAEGDLTWDEVRSWFEARLRPR